jgi:hypothetical protein
MKIFGLFFSYCKRQFQPNFVLNLNRNTAHAMNYGHILITVDYLLIEKNLKKKLKLQKV